MGNSAGLPNNFDIQIQSSQTQSQELFDYQQAASNGTQKLVFPSYLVYQGENLKYLTQKDETDAAVFAIVKPYEGCIAIHNLGDAQNTLWKVVRQGENQPIEIGNTIKIGKLKMTLKDIIQNQKELTERDATVKNQLAMSLCLSDKSKDQQCKICFEKSDTLANPLVNICKCAGSLKYTHFKCLKDWVSSNLVTKEQNNCLYYSYFQTKCEICKQIFKSEFVHKGVTYELLDLDKKPAVPYARFDNIEQENGKIKYSCWMISLVDSEEMTVGRNSNCHVAMKEISVSRIHCAFFYKNKKLFIKDKKSKFGTLIKFDSELEFSSKSGIELQFDSKLILLTEESNFGSCCCAQNDGMKLMFHKEPINYDKQINKEVFIERDNRLIELLE